jgi:hypothetical protein
MQRRSWARLSILASVLTLFLSILAPAASASGADALGRLSDSIEGSRSYKVRIQAASLLTRFKDPRVLEVLARLAASDPEPMVRAFAMKLLARNPGGDPQGKRAREVLTRGLEDRVIAVRRQAGVSLAALDKLTASTAGFGAPPAQRPARSGPMAIAVGRMGDRTGLASRAFREHMRFKVIGELQKEPNIRVADASEADLMFMVDGTIQKLDLATGPTDVETTCAVELIVSRPPRGLVLVASGEAIVQKPRAQYKAHQRSRMESEALEHAVQSAHLNLLRFLETQ